MKPRNNWCSRLLMPVMLVASGCKPPAPTSDVTGFIAEDDGGFKTLSLVSIGSTLKVPDGAKYSGTPIPDHVISTLESSLLGFVECQAPTREQALLRMSEIEATAGAGKLYMRSDRVLRQTGEKAAINDCKLVGSRLVTASVLAYTGLDPRAFPREEPTNLAEAQLVRYTYIARQSLFVALIPGYNPEVELTNELQKSMASAYVPCYQGEPMTTLPDYLQRFRTFTYECVKDGEGVERFALRSDRSYPAIRRLLDEAIELRYTSSLPKTAKRAGKAVDLIDVLTRAKPLASLDASLGDAVATLSRFEQAEPAARRGLGLQGDDEGSSGGGVVTEPPPADTVVGVGGSPPTDFPGEPNLQPQPTTPPPTVDYPPRVDNPLVELGGSPDPVAGAPDQPANGPVVPMDDTRAVRQRQLADPLAPTVAREMRVEPADGAMGSRTVEDERRALADLPAPARTQTRTELPETPSIGARTPADFDREIREVEGLRVEATRNALQIGSLEALKNLAAVKVATPMSGNPSYAGLPQKYDLPGTSRDGSLSLGKAATAYDDQAWEYQRQLRSLREGRAGAVEDERLNRIEEARRLNRK